jgi:hypothetical protein
VKNCPNGTLSHVSFKKKMQIAVFEVDRALLKEIDTAAKNGEDMVRFKGRSTLRLVQSINTIPSAFPNDMNTCGRICVHQSGRFVAVSNRGHQSICVYRVKSSGPKRGELQTVGYFHTRGETPRHFTFDRSGQYLLVANQDSDSLAVFSFNLSSGDIKYTGNEYRMPSPNFICCCPTHHDEEEEQNPPSTSSPTSTPMMVVQPPQYVPLMVGTLSDSVVSDSGGSDSEDSTFAIRTGTNKDTPTKINLGPLQFEEELEKAREEIAELKRLLAAKN